MKQRRLNHKQRRPAFSGLFFVQEVGRCWNKSKGCVQYVRCLCWLRSLFPLCACVWNVMLDVYPSCSCFIRSLQERHGRDPASLSLFLSLLCFACCDCNHSLSCQSMLGLNRGSLVDVGCPALACVQTLDRRVPRRWGISVLSPLACCVLLCVLWGCH